MADTNKTADREDPESAYFERMRVDRGIVFREQSLPIVKWLEQQDTDWVMSVINHRLSSQDRALGSESFIDESLRFIANASNDALLLISAKHRLLFMNNRAGHILEKQSSLILEENYLKGATPEFDKYFKKVVRKTCHPTTSQAQNDNAGTLTLNTPKDASMLFAAMTPVGLSEGKSTIIAVSLYDPSALPQISTERLRTWYNLSKREAQLAAAFAQGVTFSEYTEREGIAITTVRTQFAHIKAKMAAPNIATVVRLTLLAAKPGIHHYLMTC